MLKYNFYENLLNIGFGIKLRGYPILNFGMVLYILLFSLILY